MPKYTLLHNAPSPGKDLATKYNIHTYDKYVAWAKAGGYARDGHWSKLHSYNEIQKLVFTILTAMHIGGQKPTYLVINSIEASLLLEEMKEIPLKIEDVPLAYDKDNLFPISWTA